MRLGYSRALTTSRRPVEVGVSVARSWRRALSCDQFRELYTGVFPGIRFDDLDFALAMAWTAPATGK